MTFEGTRTVMTISLLLLLGFLNHVSAGSLDCHDSGILTFLCPSPLSTKIEELVHGRTLFTCGFICFIRSSLHRNMLSELLPFSS